MVLREPFLCVPPFLEKGRWKVTGLLVWNSSGDFKGPSKVSKHSSSGEGWEFVSSEDVCLGGGRVAVRAWLTRRNSAVPGTRFFIHR